MDAIAAQPSLTDLRRFIRQVPAYPLNVRQLLRLAAANRAPKEVKDFYRAFPDGLVFDDREDLTARTEQVEILRREEPQMPAEQFHAPEED